MTAAAWRPTLGALPEAGGVRFRVWAPSRERVELVLGGGSAGSAGIPLAQDERGTWSVFVPGLAPGALYRYRVDGAGPFPDPASRFQPDGVHGPSQVVEFSSYPWRADCPGLRLDELVIYELHLGTFTPEGTYSAAAARLPYLRDLGITAVELMPLADFPGRWNWGYDGVALFAPARCYGRPDELRAFVDAAHQLGLGVILDVVYNHFGPDGAYQGVYSPYYFSERHQTPWGGAINLDGPHADEVRRFLRENALHWLNEYRIDGLRLDATHALFDDSPRPFLAELAAACAESRPAARPLLIAEDHRNLDTLIRPEAAGGYGLDAVWSDDLHHQVRRALAGDDEGYYRDFSASAADMARTIGQGWFFTGQRSEHQGHARGTPTTGLAARKFVTFIQNHDQIGNRALGGRLNHDITLPAFRAATALLLCAPETPMLFMGQEWAASSPFLFFTDHAPELGRLVTEGRRREFSSFSVFRDERTRALIPDPQAESTFERSRLEWTEVEQEPHASMLRLTRALLALRRQEPLLADAGWDGFEARACGDDALALIRRRPGACLVVLVRLRGAGPVVVAGVAPAGPPATAPFVGLLSTEDPGFAEDPMTIEFVITGQNIHAAFARPGAIVLVRR